MSVDISLVQPSPRGLEAFVSIVPPSDDVDSMSVNSEEGVEMECLKEENTTNEKSIGNHLCMTILGSLCTST